MLGAVKLICQHIFALRRVLKPKMRELQVSDNIFIKHIDNAPAIYAVARQPVGQPCQNAVCFAILYALQHFVKLRASWLLGGLFFYDDARNTQPHALGKLL
ncbi:hypothetical protein EYC59_06045 [Candidatus Saccharibacteria bacterium]|nr:MAG: hypothetical protein EYC59_06045 [Candidatus Saccharibacteria bacterium]